MATCALAQQQQRPQPVGYDDTPFLPGGKWRVHDAKRPAPRVVTPGETPGAPPADAVVLFDGKDLSKWKTTKGEAPQWKVENGYMEVVAKTGDILTREEFGDCQLHLEFRTPAPPRSNSQGRSNSGVFFFGRYEIQVLDSFENPTYADGQATAIYGQTPPLVNASRQPGEWQTYDIIFTAPRFQGDKMESPPYVTVIHNGVVTHHHKEILGPTRHRALPQVQAHGPKGPIRLQDHGDPIRFRNIWVRPLRGYDEP
jgi:hypothetical protein